MIALIGFVVVLVAVIVGFVFAGGHLMVLFQPAEYLIISGCAIGMLLVSVSPKVLKELIQQILGILGKGHSKESYKNLLVMLYELFDVARREGIIALEGHVENPEESEILTKYPDFLADHHAVSFFSDTMRMIISGGISTYDLEALIDEDIETHHEEISEPPMILQKVGDALPGFGIVAAVLGVVVTMGAIGGPPEEIGHKVAAALVGTFLGILLSYGFVQPLATNLDSANQSKARYFVCIKQALLGFFKGMAPSIAVELGRRSIYNDVRPSFLELEEACREATRGGKQAKKQEEVNV
ncbi:MAG: flagellar motor stator protein MotA [candidate division Zixibacteria bacterium]|nr:flagellar motor stator protein MotA [candidate division Zixibacteria bacterium]